MHKTPCKGGDIFDASRKGRVLSWAHTRDSDILTSWARVLFSFQWGTVSFKPAMMAADTPPVTGRVTSQARMMLRNKCQSTFSRDRNRPTKTTLPTLQCVVLMGIPTLLATKTVKAEPISMQKPLEKEEITDWTKRYLGWQGRRYLEGVMRVKSSPKVFITRRPRMHNPREIPAPPYKRIHHGVAAFSDTRPWDPINQRDTNGPIALL